MKAILKEFFNYFGTRNFMHLEYLINVAIVVDIILIRYMKALRKYMDGQLV